MTFRYPVAKLRFVEKPPRQEEWRAIHRAAEWGVPAAERAFVLAVRDMRRASPAANIRAALERGVTEIAASEFNWAILERSLEDRLLPVLRQVTERAAKATVKSLERQLDQRFEVRKVDPVSVGFDLVNPETLVEISQWGARLVTMVTEETKEAVNEIVLAAQTRGLDVRQQAYRIAAVLRQGAGLNAPQARALANYEAALTEAGRSPADIRELLAARREKMIKQRARLIARQETLRGANAGQQGIWRQATDARLLPTDQKRKWLTQGGDFACPICAPMNGQVRGMNEEFESPYDGSRSLYPPHHVACLCTTVLVVED